MDLIPVPSVREFRFSSLIPKDAVLNTSEKAAVELLVCVEGVWAQTPVEFQDFLLRFFKSCGIPLDYEELPFWAHKAALHIFTVCYPTLRKSDLRHPTTEDYGRIAGHLWAMIRHAKDRTAVFEKFPGPTAEAIRDFFLRIEAPVAILIQDGISKPHHECRKFILGMSHAYDRTFDITGLPKGWNTTSRLYLGVCICWRLIANHAMPFKQLHQWLERSFGRQEIGSEERVRKAFDRMGLRFEDAESLQEMRQETVEISSVRIPPKQLPDK